MNKLFKQGGRLFNSSKGKHVLKRAESHRCEVNTLRILACNFSMFFICISKGFILENCLQNLNGVTDFGQKISKMIEPDSYSIRCIAKYQCLYTQGAVAFQTPDVLLLTWNTL